MIQCSCMKILYDISLGIFFRENIPRRWDKLHPSFCFRCTLASIRSISIHSQHHIRAFDLVAHEIFPIQNIHLSVSCGIHIFYEREGAGEEWIESSKYLETISPIDSTISISEKPRRRSCKKRFFCFFMHTTKILHTFCDIFWCFIGFLIGREYYWCMARCSLF